MEILVNKMYTGWQNIIKQHIHKIPKMMGSAAEAVACKSGHRALVARVGAVSDSDLTLLCKTAKAVPLSPNPLPPATPPLPTTPSLVRHWHHWRGHTQLLLLLLMIEHYILTVMEFRQSRDLFNQKRWCLQLPDIQYVQVLLFLRQWFDIHKHWNCIILKFTSSDLQKR